MSEFTKELDTSGLNCPLPIIKAKKEINTMETGQVLHVISTLWILRYNIISSDFKLK